VRSFLILIMADVSRWHLARIRQGDLVGAGELAKYLDTEYVSGSAYVQDLLAVSFIENLPWEHEDEALGVRSTLALPCKPVSKRCGRGDLSEVLPEVCLIPLGRT